jgi:hypothetical protein
VCTKGLDKTNGCCTFALSKWSGSDSIQRTKMYLGTNLSCYELKELLINCHLKVKFCNGEARAHYLSISLTIISPIIISLIHDIFQFVM